MDYSLFKCRKRGLMDKINTVFRLVFVYVKKSEIQTAFPFQYKLSLLLDNSKKRLPLSPNHL